MNKRILVTDDDEAVRQSLAHALESGNFEVRLASDGRETIVKFIEARPDLLVLDVKMPRANGGDALHRVNRLAPVRRLAGETPRPASFSQTVAALLAQTPAERLARLTDPDFAPGRIRRAELAGAATASASTEETENGGVL